MKPNTLLIRTAGTNCDLELAHAFELAGSSTQIVHVNQLIQKPDIIASAQIIAFPGGFSYGDDIAAGRILANTLRHHLMEPLQDAVKRSVPMIGICNGFQVMVKLGLLPDPLLGKQLLTLADNAQGRFIDQWVQLQTVKDTCCIWTQDLTTYDLPIAHGEGQLIAQSPAVLQKLHKNNQIALRYTHNPNGSVEDIAGICDSTGLVLGLMPHPERCTHLTHHPNWSKLAPSLRDQMPGLPPGLKMFENAVQHVTSPVPT